MRFLGRAVLLSSCFSASLLAQGSDDSQAKTEPPRKTLESFVNTEIKQLAKSLELAEPHTKELEQLKARDKHLTQRLKTLQFVQNYVILVPSGAAVAWVISMLGLDGMGLAEHQQNIYSFAGLAEAFHNFPFIQKMMVGAVGLGGGLAFRAGSGWMWDRLVQRKFDRIVRDFETTSHVAVDNLRSITQRISFHEFDRLSDTEKLSLLESLQAHIDDLKARSAQHLIAVRYQYHLDKKGVLMKPAARAKLDLALASLNQELDKLYLWLLLEIQQVYFHDTQSDAPTRLLRMPFLNAHEFTEACGRLISKLKPQSGP